METNTLLYIHTDLTEVSSAFLDNTQHASCLPFVHSFHEIFLSETAVFFSAPLRCLAVITKLEKTKLTHLESLDLERLAER